MEPFDRLMEHRTILFVTHHLPLISNADFIVVLREGKIVESGSHEELMEKGRVYYQFWQEQVGQLAAHDF